MRKEILRKELDIKARNWWYLFEGGKRGVGCTFGVVDIFCCDDSETAGDHMARIYDAERSRFDSGRLTSGTEGTTVSAMV